MIEALCLNPRLLPHRLTTSEVCALARVSKRTFGRRRASRKPGVYQLEPCDRGTEDLYERDQVLRALGMMHDESEALTPKVSPDAIRAARSRQVRQRPGPKGRDGAGVVRSAGAPSPVRLAFDNTAAD